MKGARGALALALVLAAPGRAGPAAAGLLELLSPEVDLELARVPDSETLCAAGALVRFRLARVARISLAVEGAAAAGGIDGGPVRTLTAVPLAAGRHDLVVSEERRRGLALSERVFTLSALEGAASAPVVATGTLRDERLDRAVLPVGRTFVSGVDLLDGHLVLQATDLKLEGRHLALEVVRTYSSAGRSGAGLVGAGWRLGYEMAVTPLPECGLALVRTGDGSTQAFVGEGPSFRPQRGYHTRLRRNPDGSFDFVDKAANRHHFAARDTSTARSLRLDWIEEPHGDRIVLERDGAGRLREVSEWHPGLGPVRTLVLEYEPGGASARVASVHAWGLGMRVRYGHDAAGNLVSATRADREDGETVDRYEYSATDPRDRHQLTAATPHGEGRTAYAFAPEPGAKGAAATVDDPRERVTAVDPASGGGTTFTYDRSAAADSHFRVEVRAPDRSVTRYLLNADGNPLEIDQPEGAARTVTRFVWDSEHVVKAREENSAGRGLRYAHDQSGNLVEQEELAKPGAPVETTTYAYDSRFNKLVRKRDAQGRTSSWTLDPDTGDLLREEEADGTVITWAYDRAGCLKEERAAQGRTLFERPDTFCNATRIHDPDGTVRRRRYDARGRLMDETKTEPPR